MSLLYGTTKYRKLPYFIQKNTNDFLDFSTNDYLGLSKNSEIMEASIDAIRKYGNGSTGSRLLSGNSVLHEELEYEIAKNKNTEEALIFISGFQANLSTLSALLDKNIVGKKPIVFFDKLNHSSLYQAVFLSNPILVRYNHADVYQLQTLLSKYKNDNSIKFIVTETVFGMDGDLAPLEEIISLAKEYNAFLYLDEAHSTGVFGKNGYGISTLFDLSNVSHVIMGTFSKALGCSGGYIACSKIIKDYLINKASGFIYSTSPPPSVVGAALCAWKMIYTLDDLRNKLKYLSQILREKLIYEGFDIAKSNTHIIPVIMNRDDITLSIKEKLLKNNISVSAIRPPTVPENSSRIRIAITANHTEQNIDKLIQILKIAL